VGGLNDPDAEVFLARLVRLDPQALVRVRPVAPDRAAIFAMLPWGTLVSREIAAEPGGDHTLRAEDALTRRENYPRHDHAWRWQLPPSGAATVEVLPAGLVRRLADAAAATLRQATESGVDGKAVGSRALRDALLDHVAVYVTSIVDGKVIEVPQRLIQAVVRMGFLPVNDAGDVAVLAAGNWIGLAATFGTAWWRVSAPSLLPISSHS
jgi:hypothetical protein